MEHLRLDPYILTPHPLEPHIRRLLSLQCRLSPELWEAWALGAAALEAHYGEDPYNFTPSHLQPLLREASTALLAALQSASRALREAEALSSPSKRRVALASALQVLDGADAAEEVPRFELSPLAPPVRSWLRVDDIGGALHELHLLAAAAEVAAALEPSCSPEEEQQAEEQPPAPSCSPEEEQQAEEQPPAPTVFVSQGSTAGSSTQATTEVQDSLKASSGVEAEPGAEGHEGAAGRLDEVGAG